ncbi:MAG: DUF2117 domain-containing protein [Methanobrevibacter sp.]|nr:DUF2117 domain-containing protein [Candidatus Methanovirga basalitermitum]
MRKDLNIGLVVHGPKIIDSNFAMIIIDLLSEFGKVKAILGGTMGRTAVIDASLEDIIDISHKRLPSESIAILKKSDMNLIVLINYGKSETTGHSFGFKVFNNSFIKNNWNIPPFIQIERPGEDDGTIIPWNKNDLDNITKKIAKHFNLNIINPKTTVKKHFPYCLSLYKNYLNSEHPIDPINTANEEKVYRAIKGVLPDENIFINGVVVGKSTSKDLTLITKDGYLVDMIGGEIKKHGVEKLSKIDLNKAIVKTGLFRTSKVKPRILNHENNDSFKVSLLNHIAEDVYSFKDCDLVITVGDDTSLVSSDVLYRFNIPIIGITDGDLDKVVESPFKNKKSRIIELEAGFDDIIGELISKKLFKSKNSIFYNLNDFNSVDNLIDMIQDKIIQIIQEKHVKFIIY